MIYPTELHLEQKSRKLSIVFNNGCRAALSCEYLRVYSPSADVRGHKMLGNDIDQQNFVLQTGKRYVNITAIEPIGNYAVKLSFNDGHQTGIYTWNWLYELSVNQADYWQKYLDHLSRAGASREPK